MDETQHALLGTHVDGTHHRAVMRRAPAPPVSLDSIDRDVTSEMKNVQQASCWEHSLSSIGAYESNWMLWAKKYTNLKELLAGADLGNSDDRFVLGAWDGEAGYFSDLASIDISRTRIADSAAQQPSQVLYYFVDQLRYGWLADAIKGWMEHSSLRKRLATAGIRVQRVNDAKDAQLVFGDGDEVRKHMKTRHLGTQKASLAAFADARMKTKSVAPGKQLYVVSRSYDGFSVCEPDLWDSEKVVGIISRGTWKNFLVGCDSLYAPALMLWGLKHQREDQCLVLAGRPLTMDMLLRLEEDGARQLNVTCDPQAAQVAAKNFEKLVPIPAQPLLFDQVKICQDDFKKNWVPVAQKSIDIVMFFTQQATHPPYLKSPYGIERGWQRALCMDELRTIQKKQPNWRITAETSTLDEQAYERTLADAKILVSPFGAGEWSYKDAHAVMHGTLFVKPLASFLNMTFSVLDQAFDVLPDCSNLEDVLSEAMSMSDDALEQRRMQAYDAVKTQLCSPSEDENDVPLRTVEGLEKIVKNAWSQLVAAKD